MKRQLYFDDISVTYTPTNIIQSNEYYPFGMQTAKSWTRQGNKNNYLYNAGNELNEESGLYETFYRGYDATLGKFLQVDPLADKYGSMNPYQYALNNPVLNNDPMGDEFRAPSGYSRNIGRISGGGGAGGGYQDYHAGTGAMYGSLMDNTSRFGGWGWGFQTFMASENERRARESAADYTEKYAAEHGESVSVDSKFTIEAKDGGSIINLSNGATISIGFGEGLKYEGFDQDGGGISVPYVLGGMENTKQALDHYFNGNGTPVSLGNKTITALILSKDFQKRHGRIISGKTTSLSGNFGVDLTNSVFHVGDTKVNYSVNCASGDCTVTYDLFAGDGFWDVDFIDEKTLGRIGIPRYQADGPGPNLERFGGTPYPYVPIQGTFTFPNPGY